MFSIYLIPILIAMFLALNMGGSGTAPSFSAAYGANLIRKDLIPGLFGIFVFAGAILAGKKVVATIGKGILPGESVTLVITSIILLAVALSLFIANIMKVPQSTSQSTVLALVGPALYLGMLKTDKLFWEIIPTWFVTPILAFLIAFIAGKLFYFFKPKIRLFSVDEFGKSKFLKYPVLLGAFYVAFAIGSNNVANASGPLVSMASNILNVLETSPEFILILIIMTLIIAPSFGIGSSFLGHRVLNTTSKEIVSFGPLGATLVSVITASLLLVASLTKGIPTSLVQMNTGAILGLGISKIGTKKILTETPLKKILTVWIVAPTISFTVSLLLMYFADILDILNYG